LTAPAGGNQRRPSIEPNISPESQNQDPSRLIPMNKSISLALLIGGIILIVYGAAASDSTASGVSRFFTGNPTDKTMWLLIGGAVAVVAGGAGLMRGSKSP